MSRHQYWLRNEEIWVTLADKPFAGGGEGNLYRIQKPRGLRRYVAKIYHPHKISKERERKIRYLLQYPPNLQQNPDAHHSVTWVRDALYQDDRFCGFLMPYTKGEKLEILTTPKIPRKHRNEWRRFDARQSGEAQRLRLLLGFNVCIAIQQVHALDRYVLVDMKPDNIVIQPNGLVSIVDTDSVEVVEGGQTLFDAPVATPEYSPPEHYRNLDYDPTQRQSWDRFGLGVILYKLLFGVHPFAASSGGRYERLTTLQDKIEHGLFVHNPEHQTSFKVVPPPHRQFHHLNPELQGLFMRCFVEGHADPEARPTAEEWCAAILVATGDEALYERYRHVLEGGGPKRARVKHFPLPSYVLNPPEPSVDWEPLLQMMDFGALELPNKAVQLKDDEYVKFGANRVNSRRDMIIVGIVTVVLTMMALIPAVAIMWMIYLNQLNKTYKSSPEYKNKERIERKRNRSRKSAEKRIKAAKKSQRRIPRSMANMGEKVKKLVNLIQREMQDLKTFLQRQDEAVRALNQRVADQYKHLHQTYVAKAQEDRAIARVESDQYKSLAQLKAAISTQKQKAVALLKKEKIEDQEWKAQYDQQRIEVKHLLQQQEAELTKQEHSALVDIDKKEKEMLQNLYAPLVNSASIGRNKDRLWKGIHGAIRSSNSGERVLLQQFESWGITSMMQIEAVDVSEQLIRLKNGKEHHFIQMAPDQARRVLRNLALWLDELKHLEAHYERQAYELKEDHEAKRRTIKQGHRIALDKLDDVRQKELQKITLGVPVEALGAPYKRLEQQYQQATAYVEELEIAFKQEEQSAIEQYEAEYETILKSSRQRVEDAQTVLLELEAKLEGYKQRIGRDYKYQRLEKSIKEAQKTLRDAKIYANEAERYRNINFKNYLLTILETK